jgi:threonine dehydrogenase-like Zn-dependent dehydrogenase
MNNLMNGIWLHDRKLSLRQDIPKPKPKAGEALVKVLRAGVCNTDLELTRGYYPYSGVLGHEFVGVVEAGHDEWLNQRVVGEINASCGMCEFCKKGIKTHCLDRTVLGIVNRNGAFAEYLSLPIANLHVVPEQVSTDAATFTEPLAAALEILEQVEISPNHRVLIVGDGKLGLLVAQAIATTGCEVLAIGRHDAKLQLLKDCGIQTGFASEIKPGSFDVAVECTGNPEGFAIALGALRARGTLVLKSTYAGKLTIDAAKIVVDEIKLVGSRCGPFAPALELLAAGKISVLPMVQARFDLQDGLAAFDRASQKGTLKVLLDVG